jgi:hypothetical protein
MTPFLPTTGASAKNSGDASPLQAHQQLARRHTEQRKRNGPDRHRSGFRRHVIETMLGKGEGKVARATDGAAPNGPAKLLGRNTSPSSAKIETASSPARKRNRNSMPS